MNLGFCYFCGTDNVDEGICNNCNANTDVIYQLSNIQKHMMAKAVEAVKIKHYFTAIEVLEEILRINFRNSDARELLGICYHQIGELNHAFNNWRYALRVARDAEQAISYLKDNWEDFKVFGSHVDEYNEAAECIKLGNYQEAVKKLKQVVENNRRFVRAYELMALAYYGMGKLEKAKEIFNSALEISPDNKAVKGYLKDIEVSEWNNLKNKSRWDEEAIKKYIPDSIINVLSVAVSVFVLLTFIFGIGYYTKSMENSDLNKQLKDTIRRLEYTNEEYEDFKRNTNERVNNLNIIYKQLMDDNLLKTEEIEILRNYKLLHDAYQLYDQGELMESAQIYKEVLDNQFFRRNVDIASDKLSSAVEYAANEYYRQGKAYFEDNNYAKAIEKFKLSLDYDRNLGISPLAHYLIAVSYESLNEIDNAVSSYRDFIYRYKEAEHRDDVLFALGTIYLDRKDRSNAERFFSTLVEEFPSYQEQVDNLLEQ